MHTNTIVDKKIVLLKRSPNNNNVNNNIDSNTQNVNETITNSNSFTTTFELMETPPNRSASSSPSIFDGELTPEQTAHLDEIDLATGLDGFLLAALRSPKDRMFLLKLDQEMERFIDDESRSRLEFPPMNSYQRLIIHRVAQYFKLSHVVDASGKAVILYKSPETQIPILRFSDLLEQDEEEKPEKSVKIMKRQQTYPLTKQQRALMNDPDSIYEGERKILSIEEREAAYLKARARIFKDVERQNNCILNDQQLEESNESSMVLNAGGVDSNRQFYNMSKQGRPMNNFPPGPPPSTIMQGHFGRPFFSGQPPPPHVNMYDSNMFPLQANMLPPDMKVSHPNHPPMPNPYIKHLNHQYQQPLPPPSYLQSHGHPPTLPNSNHAINSSISTPGSGGKFINFQRMGLIPSPMMGFPPQQVSLQPPPSHPASLGAIRPPKSTELFDPNNPPSASTPQLFPSTATSSKISAPNSPFKGVTTSLKNSSGWVGGPVGKKEGPLLFDYTLQIPYEGVKPNQANEPPKPSHILELYDFAESDNLANIVLMNATIKRVYPPSTSNNNTLPNRRPTVLAIFKNSKEANKSVQTFKSSRFKLRTWEPLPKNNNINGNLSISSGSNDNNENSTISVAQLLGTST
nr:6268_t:CDS:2 [Entrophospora candida]